MSFRIINTTNNDVYMNLALDQACMQAVRDNKQPPTIRLYGWSQPGISIGRFQRLTAQINVDAVKQDNIPITRRITGGPTMFHDQEIAYSIVAPEKMFSKDITKSFGQVIKPLLKALHSVGITAQFQPINELVYNDKVVSQSAQTRESEVLVQHGSILLRVDEDQQEKYLTQPDALAGVLTKEHTAPEIMKALQKQLVSSLRATPARFSDDEVQDAKELAKKYSDDEWIAQR